MKVSYLFSKNNKIGSRIISWAAKHENLPLAETPSHVAVLLNGTWVVESTFFAGVRVAPYAAWKLKNQELYCIPCEQSKRSSTEVLTKATRIWGKKYDWPGILYFGLCYIKLILFKTPLPKENKWQSKDRYFCTEYVGSLTGLDYSMTSPAKFLCNLLECIK